jgi:hypothetical protein
MSHSHFQAVLNIHIHKKPPVADDIFVSGTSSKRGELEPNPPQVLCESIDSLMISLTVETGDELGARKVGCIAEFE